MKKIFGLLAGAVISSWPMLALAHVGYVEREVPLDFTANQDWHFIFAALMDPGHLALIVISACTILAIWAVLEKSDSFMNWAKIIAHRASGYSEYVPLILRISLGVLLIGAGLDGKLLGPLVEGLPGLSTVEIVSGFLLIAGLFTLPISLMISGLYIAAVSMNSYMYGGLEILMISLSILIIGVTKPGIDDLLGIRWGFPKVKWEVWVPVLLRVGIGGSMVFLAIYEKFLNPIASLDVVMKYHMQGFIPVSGDMWVLGAGIAELIVGLAILIGFRLRVFGVVTLLILSASFFFFNEAIYPHVTLFGATIVLFILGSGAWSIEKHAKRLYL
jgi:uncharacterized membrane protein YphA (DoxX/SURF4 family)